MLNIFDSGYLLLPKSLFAKVSVKFKGNRRVSMCVAFVDLSKSTAEVIIVNFLTYLEYEKTIN